MKAKTISLRIATPEHWTKGTNTQPYHCDIDGARLWKGPGNQTYCDRVHTAEQIAAFQEGMQQVHPSHRAEYA